MIHSALNIDLRKNRHVQCSLCKIHVCRCFSKITNSIQNYGIIFLPLDIWSEGGAWLSMVSKLNIKSWTSRGQNTLICCIMLPIILIPPEYMYVLGRYNCNQNPNPQRQFKHACDSMFCMPQCPSTEIAEHGRLFGACVPWTQLLC